MKPKATKTVFTSDELEQIADAILLRNGFDVNGQPLEKDNVVKLRPRTGNLPVKVKRDTPAVG